MEFDNKQDLRIAVIVLLITIALLTMFGCKQSDAGTPVVNDPTFAAPAPNPVPQPELSIFKNWGFSPSMVPSDFSKFSIGVTKWFKFYFYDSGYWGNDVHEVRLCMMKMTFNGSNSQGTITVTEAQTAWGSNAYDYAFCPQFDGVYNYSVDSSGALIGKAGQELLYTEQAPVDFSSYIYPHAPWWTN